MYIITDHNNQNFVILGPIAWKPRYISNILSDELEQNITITADDEARVPYEPVPGIKIRRCTVQYEEINSKIETHDGPYWSYDDSKTDVQVVGSWVRKNKPIDIVKSGLKNIVADLRWKKESEGITLQIQGLDVWCDTSRGNRDIFLQKYALMADTDVINWKFPSTWLALTKTDLGYIVSSGGAYIQSCFDWEAEQAAIIDSCTTLTELDALVFE